MAQKKQNSSSDNVGRDKVNQQVNVSRDYVDNSNQTITNKVEIDNTPLRPPAIPDYYSPSEVLRATKYFVETKWQQIAPSLKTELRNAYTADIKAAVIPYLIDKTFSPKLERQTDFKFHLILADSGMGKTTLLINLFKRWNSKERHKEMRLYPIASSKSWVEIEKVKKAGKAPDTILLLDAFDEDKTAVENYKKRLEDIIYLTQDFYKVLITSRTQFFPTSKEIVSEVKIRLNTQNHLVQHMYISPFDDKDVDKYLKKRFGGDLIFWNNKRKKLAKNIASKAPNLMVRPMLLAYIDDLLEDKKEYQYSFQVYEEMVKKWVAREAARIEDEKRDLFAQNLYKFSVELAVYLYKNPYEGEYVIFHKDLEPFARESGIDLSKMEMTSKSLLNRNAEGYYKFSHKSVLEYFLMIKYIESSNFALNFNFKEMSQAKTFHKEIINHLILLRKQQEITLIKGFSLIRADLDEANLEGIELDQVSLEKASLQKVDLQRASLHQVNLTNANLQEAKLQEAKLQRANLWGTNFQKANLESVNLSRSILWVANLQEANLFEANLQETDLRGANLEKANLRNADLRGANLQNTNLEYANLHEANFQGNSLQSTSLEGASLQYANLEKANLWKVNLQEANLQNANLQQANLKGANLQEANLQNANLTNANLSKANLLEANLYKAKLALVDLREVNLQEANLFKANLKEVDLYDADLRGAKLEYAQLQRANLWLANLENAQLEGAHLQKAKLSGANLRDTNLKGADLKEADLRGADLRNTNLEGADLQKANLWLADLQQANLRETNLRGANLKLVDLHGADLQGVYLSETNLQETDLQKANLSNSTLTQSQYDYAKKQGAILENVNIVPDQENN